MSQDKKKNTKSNEPRAVWTSESDVQCFLEVLKEVVGENINPAKDTLLKSHEWTPIHTKFLANCHASCKSFTKQHLKDKLKCLKKDYTTFQFLVDNSGFGWDERLKIPTAPRL